MYVHIWMINKKWACSATGTKRLKLSNFNLHTTAPQKWLLPIWSLFFCKKNIKRNLKNILEQKDMEGQFLATRTHSCQEQIFVRPQNHMKMTISQFVWLKRLKETGINRNEVNQIITELEKVENWDLPFVCTNTKYYFNQFVNKYMVPKGPQFSILLFWTLYSGKCFFGKNIICWECSWNYHLKQELFFSENYRETDKKKHFLKIKVSFS